MKTNIDFKFFFWFRFWPKWSWTLSNIWSNHQMMPLWQYPLISMIHKERPPRMPVSFSETSIVSSLSFILFKVHTGVLIESQIAGKTRLRVNLRPRVDIFKIKSRPCWGNVSEDHVIFFKIFQFDLILSNLSQFGPIRSNLILLDIYLILHV